MMDILSALSGFNIILMNQFSHITRHIYDTDISIWNILLASKFSLNPLDVNFPVNLHTPNI